MTHNHNHYGRSMLIERERRIKRIEDLEKALELSESKVKRRDTEIAELQRRLRLRESDAMLDSPGYHHQIPSGVVGCPLCCETGCACDKRH